MICILGKVVWNKEKLCTKGICSSFTRQESGCLYDSGCKGSWDTLLSSPKGVSALTPNGLTSQFFNLLRPGVHVCGRFIIASQTYETTFFFKTVIH